MFSAVNGYVDDVPLDQVRRFEEETLGLCARAIALLAAIADTKEISEVTAAKLHDMLKAFSAAFLMTTGSAA